jgi:hypothetical protein
MMKRARISEISEVSEISDASEGSVVPTEDSEMKEPGLGDLIQQTNYSKGDMSTIFEMLQDLSASWFPDVETQGKMRQQLVNIQVVTRAEEENFLRTKVVANGERDCAKGKDCEGTKLDGPPSPVILVEHWLQSTPRPIEPQLCILCKRAAATYFFVNSQAEGDDMNRLFQGHANIMEQPGEYSIDQCNISGSRETHGALLPCVIHCRAYYEYNGAKDGIHWFIQSGYKYPDQDFR